MTEQSEITQFIDEDGWRIYEIDGERYPSVTTIIHNTVLNKKLIDYYKNNSANKIAKRLEETGNFGTEAHRIFESILMGGLPAFAPEFAPHVKSFKEWVEKDQVLPKKLETIVYSKKYGFAGRLDFFGTIQGKPKIADFKTSTHYSITNGFQLSAYLLAALEMELVPENTGLAGISVNRVTGVLKPFMYEHLDWCELQFLSILQAFKGIHYYKLDKIGWPWLHQNSVEKKGTK